VIKVDAISITLPEDIIGTIKEIEEMERGKSYPTVS
jgi:hypothetical protein